MTQRSMQRTAVAAALAMVLALAAPAHAAGRHVRAAEPGWMDTVLQWVTQLWPGATAESGLKAPGLKSDEGAGVASDGSHTTTQPNSNADKGIGIDPDG